MIRVAIIDYGMCNLGSVRRAFEECGADAVVTDDPRELRSASHVVLPGVGAFCDGISNLRHHGWEEAIQNAVGADKLPFLGICLGMQLLAGKGQEGGETRGLGLIPGEVTRLIPSMPQERIPHVGWNEVFHVPEDPLFMDIADGTDFYFVHSFHFTAEDKIHEAGRTPYCGGFTSYIRMDNVFGVQFHPEKSSLAGFKLIKNFLEYRS